MNNKIINKKIVNNTNPISNYFSKKQPNLENDVKKRKTTNKLFDIIQEENINDNKKPQDGKMIKKKIIAKRYEVNIKSNINILSSNISEFSGEESDSCNLSNSQKDVKKKVIKKSKKSKKF